MFAFFVICYFTKTKNKKNWKIKFLDVTPNNYVNKNYNSAVQYIYDIFASQGIVIADAVFFPKSGYMKYLKETNTVSKTVSFFLQCEQMILKIID